MSSAFMKKTEPADGGGSPSKGSGSCSSESSSTEEDERLRRLFAACDRDGDGFIDSQDLLHMCRLLNMEDAAGEIRAQLGVDASGRISFDDFSRCRTRLMGEIEEEQFFPEEGGPAGDIGGLGVEGRRPRGPHPVLLSHRGQDGLGLLPAGVPGRPHYNGGESHPDHPNLYRLLQNHDPVALHRYLQTVERQDPQDLPDLLEVANSLHLAALTSLKGEIIDLSTRLKHLSNEKESLEKQLIKQQTDKLRLQREAEEKAEELTQRYEERLIELHSVIAELRKKLDRHQINVIREEEEFDGSDDPQPGRGLEDGLAPEHPLEEETSVNDEISINENNANESQANSIAEFGHEIKAELSRVMTELDSAINERNNLPVDAVPNTLIDKLVHPESQTLEQPTAEMEMAYFAHAPPLAGEHAGQLARLDGYEQHLVALRQENAALQEQVGRQETDLNRLRAQLGGVREERDRYKRRTRELQTRYQSLEAASPQPSRTATPSRGGQGGPTDRKNGLAMQTDQPPPQPPLAPIAKVAELKKLKTGSGGDRQVLGAEISVLGLSSAKVAEHLAQPLQECSNVQEVVQSQGGTEIPADKVRAFEIEQERLQSRIDHLKAQNDLLSLTLEESKAHCDRLTVLMGKYESNNTALQLAVSYSDQALEAYQLLVALLEGEQATLLAHCRAAGLGSLAGDQVDNMRPLEESPEACHKAQLARKSAEHVAKQLLQRLDRSLGVSGPICTASPWEDLSSHSHTTSTTSSTSSTGDGDWSKADERRLREHLERFKVERTTVRMTVMELESVHIDPTAYDGGLPNPDCHRLDLENAVLMQELMAMKEEKAELKAQNYLLEKEHMSLELQLRGKQSQEQAYRVQIEHLQSEVSEVVKQQRQGRGDRVSQDDSPLSADGQMPALTLGELRTHDSSQLAQDLSDALRRERKLKSRIQELVQTVDKLSKNSEIRHQQSAEFVNDLKRANSALISSFEKSKRKYQSKIKKLEGQLQALADRYEAQVRLLKKQFMDHQDELSRRHASETSL